MSVHKCLTIHCDPSVCLTPAMSAERARKLRGEQTPLANMALDNIQNVKISPTLQLVDADVMKTLRCLILGIIIPQSLFGISYNLAQPLL